VTNFVANQAVLPGSASDSVTIPEDSWLILGSSDYWTERIGGIIDRIRPEWICIRTRTPGTADGPRNPSFTESLEVIERFGREVIRHFQH